MQNKIPLKLPALVLSVLVVSLLSGFALAQKCGDGMCSEIEFDNGICPKDCQGEAVGEGYAPLAQPKLLSTTVLGGIILVLILVIAGYAVHATGKPTPYWKQKHGHFKAKKK